MKKIPLPSKYFLPVFYYLIPIKIMILKAKIMNILNLNTDGFLTG